MVFLYHLPLKNLYLLAVHIKFHLASFVGPVGPSTQSLGWNNIPWSFLSQGIYQSSMGHTHQPLAFSTQTWTHII